MTLLHLMDRLMERQLDASAGALLKSLVEKKGINVLLNASTAAFWASIVLRASNSTTDAASTPTP